MADAVRVAVPVFPGFEELDAIGPFEVFGLAAQCGLPVSVRVVAAGGVGAIEGFHGLKIADAGPLTDAFDWVIVPGGAWLAGRRDGVRLAIEDGELPRWIAGMHRGGATIGAVCTGAFVIEAAGLLAGRKATTHHLAFGGLRDLGVDVVEDRVVDAGSVLTAGGVSSGLDLALWMIERHFGSEAAARIGDVMEYRRQGSVLRVGG